MTLVKYTDALVILVLIASGALAAIVSALAGWNGSALAWFIGIVTGMFLHWLAQKP